MSDMSGMGVHDQSNRTIGKEVVIMDGDKHDTNQSEILEEQE